MEVKRDQLEADAVFYYADEFDVSWQPTLKAMWSPVGQQVMIPTLGQTNKRFGIGAVNYHTGETVVILRKRKRRDRTAEAANRGATNSTAGGPSDSDGVCGLGQCRHP